MFRLTLILGMILILIGCATRTYKDDDITPEEFFSLTPEETFELDISPERRAELVNEFIADYQKSAEDRQKSAEDAFLQGLEPSIRSDMERFMNLSPEEQEIEVRFSRQKIIENAIAKGNVEYFEVVNYDTTHVNGQHIYKDIIVKDISGKVFEIQFDEHPKMGLLSIYSIITVVPTSLGDYILVESISKY